MLPLQDTERHKIQILLAKNELTIFLCFLTAALNISKMEGNKNVDVAAIQI